MKSKNVLLNSAMHAKISDVSVAAVMMPLSCTTGVKPLPTSATIRAERNSGTVLPTPLERTLQVGLAQLIHAQAEESPVLAWVRLVLQSQPAVSMEHGSCTCMFGKCCA